MPNFDGFEVEFLSRFPEWKDDFERNFGDYRADSERIGQYIIFGDFIIPLMSDLALEKNDRQLQRLFDFFEEVATWDDDSETLIHVEIGEWLVEGLVQENAYLQQFAGPFVRLAMRTIEEYNRGKR